MARETRWLIVGSRLYWRKLHYYSVRVKCPTVQGFSGCIVTCSLQTKDTHGTNLGRYDRAYHDLR